MKKKSSLFPAVALSILGSFFQPLSAAPSIWEANFDGELLSLPADVEVQAEGSPEDFRGNAGTTAVAIVEDPAGTSRKVLGLRDATEPSEKIGASISKSGFSAAKGKLSFRFYTRTPRRNGNILVRLLNQDGKTVASFQIYAKGRENGEIQLNTLGPEGDRRAPEDKEIYTEKSWTPVVLDYNGADLKWSLSVGDKEFKGIPVDASLVDTKVEKFEIHTGFGASSKTILYVDSLSFETVK